MNKIKISLFLILTFQVLLAGTTGKLAGTVKDEKTNEPLIGCNIMIDGTPMGAASDQNGDFVI